MKITWMGTASFILEAAGERILFDPFVELTGGAHPGTVDDFLQEETIFVTHGHFDHLFYIPQILEEGDVTVFCTEYPARTLENFTDATGNVAALRVGDRIPIGGIQLRVLKGAHIVFDKRRAHETLSPSRIIRYAKNLPFLLYANHKFKDGGETVSYEICAEGKKLLLLGSLALAEDEQYPEHVDLLILPYQGSNDLESEAAKIIRRLKPKRILLSHFDNAFPPMSRNVDTRAFKKLMDEHWPEIKVVKPTYKKPVRI